MPGYFNFWFKKMFLCSTLYFEGNRMLKKLRLVVFLYYIHLIMTHATHRMAIAITTTSHRRVISAATSIRRSPS